MSFSMMWSVVFGSILFLSAEACPEIVQRADWGARSPTSAVAMATPVSEVFIHHTAGAPCSDRDSCVSVAQQTQNLHMDNNGWPDLGYNFLIGGDGSIYEGRGWDKVGFHTVNYNDKAIAISFMGNFENEPANENMLNAARSLIDCGVEQGFITPEHELHGHRDASCTACPGEQLYAEIRGWPRFVPGPVAGYTC